MPHVIIAIIINIYILMDPDVHQNHVLYYILHQFGCAYIHLAPNITNNSQSLLYV